MTCLPAPHTPASLCRREQCYTQPVWQRSTGESVISALKHASVTSLEGRRDMSSAAPWRPQVSPAYARWAELLRTLGVVDSPAPHHLLQLLAGVTAAAGGAPLNANERRAALRLLDTLCDGDADAAQVGRGPPASDSRDTCDGPQELA